MKYTLFVFILTGLFLVPHVNAATTNNALIERLLAQIAVLRTELAKLQVTTPSCTFTRLLKQGTQGTDVTCLQNFLKSKGYFSGTPTGLFGPQTEAAVSSWQHSVGIVAEPWEYGHFGEQSRMAYVQKTESFTEIVPEIKKEAVVLTPDLVKIPEKAVRPEITASQPKGNIIGTSTTELSVTTEDVAKCRYGTSSQAYNALPYALSGDDTRSHRVTLSGLSQRIEYSYTVRCIDTAGMESSVKRIRFTLVPEVVMIEPSAPVVSTQTHQSSFVVFDNVAYVGKPENSFPGFKPIKILYWSNFGEGNDYVEPNEVKTRTAVHFTTASTTDNLLVLDIEHWPTTATTTADTVRKYNQVADWIKSERPELKIGYYGIPPRRNYSDAISTSTVRHERWHAVNDSLAGMVPHVDVLYPSLYTFNKDIPAWVTYAKANIAEAKRLANGKPIYPYIWYKYHDSTPLKNQFIEPEFWRVQLETIKDAGADGVVIWGSESRTTWTGTEPWWLETKSFVSTLSESDTPMHISEVKQPAPLMNATTRQSLRDIYAQLLILKEHVKDLKE